MTKGRFHLRSDGAVITKASTRDIFKVIKPNTDIAICMLHSYPKKQYNIYSYPKNCSIP